MGKDNIFDMLRNLIGSISWKLFLWANRTTAEEYWKEIFEQEKAFQLRNNLDRAIKQKEIGQEQTKGLK